MIRLLLIVIVWCALWGDVSFANVLSGALIGVVVLGLGPMVNGRVHVVPLAKLVWLMLVDLVVSTVVVAREVVWPSGSTEGFVLVELPPEAEPHLFMLTVLVTLTPGTAVARVDREAITLEIYTFDLADSEAIEHHTHRLADYAIAGLPEVEERTTGWRLR
jgi:multicomponent Na+:H+ antiporter subunit E